MRGPMMNDRKVKRTKRPIDDSRTRADETWGIRKVGMGFHRVANYATDRICTGIINTLICYLLFTLVTLLP